MQVGVGLSFLDYEIINIVNILCFVIQSTFKR